MIPFQFFFKAIVTVNLTALLVLTTLFISVSSALPSTAYVKMVDVWLIFAQLVPWVEVCLYCLDFSFTEDLFRCCNTQRWRRLGKRRELGISTTMARSYRSVMRNILFFIQDKMKNSIGAQPSYMF